MEVDWGVIDDITMPCRDGCVNFSGRNRIGMFNRDSGKSLLIWPKRRTKTGNQKDTSVTVEGYVVPLQRHRTKRR